MKRLRFKLISNENTLIDEIINYIESDESLKFKINEDLYELRLDEDILIKKNNESTITIDFKHHKMIINPQGLNQDFYMDITDIKIRKDNKIIELMYTFINDEKTTNCINIEYI